MSEERQEKTASIGKDVGKDAATPGQVARAAWEEAAIERGWTRAADAPDWAAECDEISAAAVLERFGNQALDLMETDRNRWRMAAVAGWALFLIFVALTGFLR